MRRITSGTACSFMAAVENRFSQSTNSNLLLSPLQAQHRLFHPSDHDLDSDLDELCKKHIELPAEDFANGCRKYIISNHIYV